MKPSATAEPVLQLTRLGAVWHRPDDVPRLRDDFSRTRCVMLPGFLEPSILKRIQGDIERAQFEERSYGSDATEICMEANATSGVLHFLVNDPRVFQLVEDVSSCAPIRSMLGRVYRHLPGRHYHRWHGDVAEGREAGLSINLSRAVYEGGVFEIREADTERALGTIANVGVGDAILFRIAPTLEHRVTELRGTAPKTAFAGWFRRSPDYAEALRRDPFLGEHP